MLLWLFLTLNIYLQSQPIKASLTLLPKKKENTHTQQPKNPTKSNAHAYKSTTPFLTLLFAPGSIRLILLPFKSKTTYLQNAPNTFTNKSLTSQPTTNQNRTHNNQQLKYNHTIKTSTPPPLKPIDGVTIATNHLTNIIT